MPILIDRLPFGSVASGTMLTVPKGDPIPLMSDRIVIWVSITSIFDENVSPGSIIFPAVIDTGFNQDFLITRKHLMGWTEHGVYEHCLDNGLFIRPVGEAIPLTDALVWIHPNKPGTREILPNGMPYRLTLPTGIAVTSTGSRYEKSLPLLGLAAIRFSEMRVRIDGKHETVTIEVP